VSGSFSDLRTLGRYAHVMTTQNVNYYSWLTQPLERYNFPEGLTNEEYAAQATELALNKTIPEFCNRVLEELMMSIEEGGDLPNLARISLFTNATLSGEDEDDEDSNDIEEVLNENGPINSLSLIHSLDMEQETGPHINISTSGTFLPSYWSRFYLGDGTVIVAGQGSSFSWWDRRSSTATYFVGFEAQEASSSPHSVGKVDGFLRDSYAMDVHGSELRVATTVQRWGWWWWWGQGEQDENESSTENYVIILDMQDKEGSSLDTMSERGREKIGKKDETITAVRFMDEVAYVVTFERTDPLYVIDLMGEKGPKAVGELEVSGFSNYLHPMNKEKTMLLAIGQEANKDGVQTGLKLAVFNVTDPRKPAEVATYVIEQELKLYSYSNSQDDYKSARYLMDAKRLIIPVDIYDWDWKYDGVEDRTFHGFITYYVDDDRIEEECRVKHQQEYDFYAFARRSMVFNGNLMTTFSKSVKSTDMDSCKLLWNKTVQAEV